jgi:hypothetical protein
MGDGMACLEDLRESAYNFREQGEFSMRASVAAVSAVSILSTVLLVSPASSQGQRPLCPALFGQSIKVSGKITRAYVEDGVAKYELNAADSPCASLYFNVVDPRGQLQCKEGQQISASGLAVDNGLGANLSSTDYSCQMISYFTPQEDSPRK